MRQHDGCLGRLVWDHSRQRAFICFLFAFHGDVRLFSLGVDFLDQGLPNLTPQALNALDDLGFEGRALRVYRIQPAYLH